MEINIVAPYLLRSYAWQLLKVNAGMSESDYGGVVPIVPLAEEDEVKKWGKPYIVYAYSEDTPIGPEARLLGNMAFAVNAPRVSELSKTVNILTRAFERSDKSAKDVNEYTSTISSFVGIRFGTIDTTLVEVDEPEDSEGGIMQGMVNIRYEYYAQYDNLVTSLATWDGTKYVKN